MTEPFTVLPVKVHVLTANAKEVDVENIIQTPEVTLDPASRSISVSSAGRKEEGSIEGDLVASARGLKVPCAREGDDRKSLHLAFSEPAQLDELVERLEGAGLRVIRSQDDPDFKTEV